MIPLLENHLAVYCRTLCPISFKIFADAAQSRNCTLSHHGRLTFHLYMKSLTPLISVSVMLLQRVADFSQWKRANTGLITCPANTHRSNIQLQDTNAIKTKYPLNIYHEERSGIFR